MMIAFKQISETLWGIVQRVGARFTSHVRTSAWEAKIGVAPNRAASGIV